MIRRLAVALLLLGACQAPDPFASGAPCLAGGSCARAMQLALAAEVIPSALSASSLGTSPMQELPSVSLDPDTGELNLTVDDPVELSGRVRLGGAGSIPVKATLVATRPSRISGRPDVFQQATVDGSTGAFSLIVAPAATYRLRVIPLELKDQPPQQFTVEVQHNHVGAELVLDAPDSLLEVRGRVTDPLALPITGMQVQAIDPATHEVISTTAVTADDGAYVLKLRGGAGPTVHLSARPGKTTPIGTPVLEAALDLAKATSSTPVTADLEVPPLPAAARIAYRVLGVSPSGAEVPVVGATCAFEAKAISDLAQAAGVNATYRVQAETDEEGTAVVDLIPGDKGNREYQVSVSPPAMSDFQAATVAVAVGSAGGWGAPIFLPLRAVVTGRVLGPRELPVGDLVIVPAPSSVAASQTAASIAEVPKLASSQTDTDGRFVLRVDSGAYDLGLIPPAGTLLPRRWLEGVQIAADTDLGVVLLPAGTIVRGRVRDPEGRPLLGATIRLYTVSGANLQCGKDLACLQPPRLRAEGMVGADGVVPLVLPSESP